MNTTPLFFRSPTPVLFGPVRAQTPKNAALSAGQLLDVEMGLFLLSQLLPTAPPDSLPALMASAGSSSPNHLNWTARHQKLLNRGRLVLGHCLQPVIWSALLDRYATAAIPFSAYDISRDRSWFGEKTVGFSRNRLTVLRKMLA